MALDMRKIVMITVILLSLKIYAQDETIKKLRAESTRQIKKDEKDTSQKVWKKGGFFSLNLAQTSLSNWAAGGDNYSLSVNSILSAFGFYKKDKISWDNTFDLNLGYLETTSLGSRKNNDRIDLLSKYGYAIAPKWNVGALFNFRSQLFKGYNYTNPRTLNSSFLSPAYVLLSLGFDYKPNANFSAFISPATIRWIIVKDNYLAAKGLYGVDSGHHYKTEFGAFASLNYVRDFSAVLSYKGRLDLFSNYLHNPQNINIYFTNIFALKISKVLSATWNLDLIYDDNTKLFGPNKNSPALQVSSLVGVGLLVRF
ncbi:MAG: DUF3078 domain-containing protein [Flavisolibacter sp.]